jgi:hypothetical protein
MIPKDYSQAVNEGKTSKNAKKSILLRTSPWTGFELPTLVVIDTDCTGSCKSNYHNISTTMVKKKHKWSQRAIHIGINKNIRNKITTWYNQRAIHIRSKRNIRNKITTWYNQRAIHIRSKRNIRNKITTWYNQRTIHIRSKRNIRNKITTW